MPSPPGPLHGVQIVHFGHLDPDYARNRILAKALRRAGAQVVTVTDQRTFLRRTPRLVRETRRLRPDLVLVGFPGQADVPMARLAGLGRNTPVVFDPLISIYEMNVDDRELFATTSLAAKRFALEDRLAARFADLVLLDTDEHIRYYAERFGVPRAKFERVWVGADDEVMTARPPRRGDTFRVLFYGSFIPLHGVEHIVRAAHIIEARDSEIEFVLVGEGQTHARTVSLLRDLGLRSVELRSRVPLAELAELVADCDVCLGIFGTSEKAQRVIPNKVFDALAVGRPIITADSPAVREALVDGEHALLCPPGDPEALAAAILRLKDDAALRSRLAEQGHDLFLRTFSLDATAAQLAPIVTRLLGR